MKSVRKCKKSVGKCKRKQLGGNLWENVTFSWKLMTLSIFNHGNAFGRIREIKFADSDNVQFWGKTAEKKHAVDYRACGRWSIWERLIVCEQRKLPRQNAFPSNAQGDLAAGAFHWHLTTWGLICVMKSSCKNNLYIKWSFINGNGLQHSCQLSG